MATETVWIVARTREDAERTARLQRVNHHTTYAAAEYARLGLPLGQRDGLSVFDVERTVSDDGVILTAAKAGLTAAGFVMLAWSLGMWTIAGAA
jgi:hypothetical protein